MYVRATNVIYSTLLLFVLTGFFVCMSGASGYANKLHYKKNYTAEQVYPGGDEYKEIDAQIPVTAVYKNGEVIGYVFATSDVTPSIGYSGKPITILAGIDLDGNIVGAKIAEHHEPILLTGISFETFENFVNAHIGLNVLNQSTGVKEGKSQDVELISSATVTAMVVNDSLMKAGRKVLTMLECCEFEETAEKATLKKEAFEQKTWTELTGDGSIRRIKLSHEDVNRAFASMGGPERDLYGEYDRGEGDEDFIDLYTGLITPASIGQSLLGKGEYEWLINNKLKKDEHAIIIAANGSFSFRGSGFVRGGIFDRILLVQGDKSFRFRDRDYKRIGAFVQEDAPRFKEIGVFVIRKTAFEDSNFDPTQPWQLELLVSRHVGAIEKIFTTFTLNYTLPSRYIEKPEKIAAADTVVPQEADQTPALWKRIWHDRVVDITILSIALLLLTIVFFFQDFLVHYPVLIDRIRLGFLLFALIWIGGYAHAQLSVVNVFTFINSLLTGFSWDFFLLDPMIFILWSAVAVSLLFWGRGVFCGWLCPFGALQELLNRAAKRVGIKQLKIPFAIHERLWTIKYIIFLALLALSLYSLAMAEIASEVEPFKTAFLLNFDREWPFVLYAGLLLGIGLFCERFFCRYICPLGAALAIPAHNRLFRWLKRRKECGTECHRCAHKCMVQAIHETGEINANECIYCLGCQVIYYDDNTCLPLIQRRLKMEERKATAARRSREIREKKALEAKQSLSDDKQESQK